MDNCSLQKDRDMFTNGYRHIICYSDLFICLLEHHLVVNPKLQQVKKRLRDL